MTVRPLTGTYAGEPSKEAVSARIILELLRHRHPAPEWATFAELAIATGGAQRIDLFAVNVWRSNNLRRVAYEIKVSRGDFARELADPTKRQPAEELANECWFAMPAGTVRPDEVPEGWGLLEMNAGGLRAKKRAQQRHVEPPSPEFVASLARRSSDAPSRFPVVTWLKAGRELSEDDLYAAAGEELKLRIHDARRDAVAKFKEDQGYRRLEQIERIARKHLGYGFAPELLDKTLAGKAAAVNPLKRDRALMFDIRAARDALTRLLEDVE